MNNKSNYQTVNNVPIGCNFCGAQVQGRVTEKKDPRSQQIVKECRWICPRCGNLSKIGNVN
jgi:transposase-like protein